MAGGSLNPKELLDFNQQMMKIFLGNGDLPAAEQSVQNTENVAQQTEDGKVLVLDSGGSQQSAEGLKQAAADALEINIQTVMEEGKEAVLPEKVLREDIAADIKQEETDVVQQAKVQESVLDSENQMTAQTAESGKYSPDRIKNLLSDAQIQQLSKQLKQVPELSQNPVLFSEGALSEDITSKELLQFLEQAFSSDNPFSRQALGSLVSSKAYRALVRNVMEKQWLLKPEELTTEHKVEELYERLDRQLGQMEKVLKEFGQNTQQLTNTAANVRENIQFMNQLNQTYAYVQIPLKLAGQNAHSDLYVYTDKRKARQKDGELTAFLHLDLDHLGSTDVSIKLHQKKVTTNFYIKDDVSYQLLMDHLDELERRLNEKGYHAKIHVENQEEKVNFVEDLLKQGTPSAGGMVHRYSFDVRA